MMLRLITELRKTLARALRFCTRYADKLADFVYRDDRVDTWGLDKTLRDAAQQAVALVEDKYGHVYGISGVYKRAGAMIILSNTAYGYRERDYDLAIDWALRRLPRKKE